jgi:hypothetical protein
MADEAAVEQLIEVRHEEAGGLLDAPRRRTVQTQRARAKAGRVGNESHLEGPLGSVGEGGGHVRREMVRSSKSFLRARVSIGVLQALHVAEQHTAESEPLDEAEEIHHHSGLVAIGVGEQDPGGVQSARGKPSDGLRPRQGGLVGCPARGR